MDVSSTVKIALLIVVPMGVWIAFLRMPRWLVLSLHRHRLWRLRDQVVDDMIYERLPKTDPAVRQLQSDVEWVINETASLTMLVLHVMRSIPRAHPTLR